MVDIAQVISDAFELYKERWRDVVVPFLVLFVIAIVFGLVSFGLSLTSKTVCKNAVNPYILIALCYVPQIMQYAFGIVEGLVQFIVILAVLIPLWELISGAKVSDWSVHLGEQLLNAIKVIVLRTALMLLVILPLIVFVILNLTLIVAAMNSGGGLSGLVTFGGFAVLVGVIVAAVVLMIVINFLLTFLEIEMVVGGKGLLGAIGASYGRVMANVVPCFLFNLVWWLLQIAIGLLTTVLICCTLCLAYPVAIIVSPLIVAPVMWISKLMLWKELGGGAPQKRELF